MVDGDPLGKALGAALTMIVGVGDAVVGAWLGVFAAVGATEGAPAVGMVDGDPLGRTLGATLTVTGA